MMHQELIAQRKHIRGADPLSRDQGLITAAAFVRGIRDIGYKHSGTALDELVDNALQAGAARIDVVFDANTSDRARPSAIAIVDDGHGMDPESLRVAVAWGGTHRANDRQGFGRYGYGLPTSCLSQGRRFSVYSRPIDGSWHSVSIDADAIGQGAYTDVSGRTLVPAPMAQHPPDWIMRRGDCRPGCHHQELSHGTVVIVENLDRLSWKTSGALSRNLLTHFGIVYRWFLEDTDIWVDGQRVMPIDPLFTTPGMLFYDLDNDLAEPLNPLTIEIHSPSEGDILGAVRVRFAYMSPTFARENKSGARGPNNERFSIMRDHAGIIFTRAGRQIDVVSRVAPFEGFPDGFTTRNNDRYWGVEVDFTPSLDEAFSVTTTKQQVTPSEPIWALLYETGVFRVIKSLRHRYLVDSAAISRKVRKVAAWSENHSPDPGQSVTLSPTYRVVFDERLGQKFFAIAEANDGVTPELRLNPSHRFYSDLYVHLIDAPQLREELEAMLFSIGTEQQSQSR